MINLTVYTIFTGFVFVSIYWYWRLIKNHKWLLRNSQNQLKNQHSEYNIYICIPVLNEIHRIEKTISYFCSNFCNKNIKLVIITTEKEYDLNGDSVNTIDIVNKITLKNDLIEVYHYPYKHGKMAHQLNFAINNIIKADKSSNPYFCIYNADSRPHPATFKWVIKNVQEHGYKVMQQYGNYCKNFNNFNGIFSSSILKTAAIWQSRWSIGFEINNNLKQNKYNTKSLKINYPLNYCIGHGLFFDKEIFQKLNGLNEDMYNEDAIFGLHLSFLQEYIAPIPFFDEADTPDTVKSLYIQKSNWYFGPLQAWKYYKVIDNKKITCLQRIRLFLLSFKLFSHAAYWILGPTFFFAILTISIIKLNILFFMLFIIQWLLFLVIPGIITFEFLRNKIKASLGETVKALFLGSLFCYFLHGLSAYRTFYLIFINKLFNKKLDKGKTVMKNEI